MGYNDKRYEDEEKGKSGNQRGKGNNRRSNRSGRNNRSNSDRRQAPRDDYDDIHSNDISWYNKIEPYYSDAVRVPFNRIMGEPIDFSNGTSNTVTGEAGVQAIHSGEYPGVMVINYIPSIGKASTPNDPVNRAFNSMYGDIYSRTTGAMQFQQADLALWVMGMNSILTHIGEIKRAMGLANLYASQNKYWPRAYVEALGINFEDLVGRQDEYRRRLNNSILNLNQMKVPNIFDIFKRQYALGSNVWADEDSVLAQMYAFRSVGYYVYDDTTETGGQLTFTRIPLVTANLDERLNELDSMLLAWRNSSDLGLIKGSVERAYKDESFLVIEPITLDILTVPTYDKIMTYQINNMTISPVSGAIFQNLNITQDPVNNILKFEPQLFVPNGTWNNDDNANVLKSVDSKLLKLLNSFDGDTSAEFIMEATRLMWDVTFPGTISTSGMVCNVVNMGAELVESVTIHYYRMSDGEVIRQPRILFGSINIGGSGFNAPTDIFNITQVSKFRNGPRIRLFGPSPAGTTQIDYGYIGDIYRYTTLDSTALAGLNEAALQSIYLVMTSSMMR